MGADRQEVTLTLEASQGKLSFARFGLEIESGPEQGRRIDALERTLDIGTAAGNHICLTDPSVSRHHCSLRVTDQGVLVVDHQSKNGTAIDGVHIHEAFIRPNQVLTLGESRLRFVVGDGKVEVDLSRTPFFDRVFGKSPAMRSLFAVLPKLSAVNSTVLLTGETGTGKSLIAKALHRQGPRKDGPFIAVDCGALPRSLIESELFGHEQGAFTGAKNARAGAFESANGGTVFLDEVGELPLELQTNFLHALEERAVRRIGSQKQIALDVRVITATHRDLRSAVNQGTFRADLYYRLNTISIEVPPLRQRRDDIPLLVEHFYKELGAAAPSAELMASFEKADWPGNIRELKNAVERAVVLGDVGEWQALTEPHPAGDEASFGEGTSPGDGSFSSAKDVAIARWETWYLSNLMRLHDGNLTQAARSSNMDRKYLRTLLKKRGLHR